MFLPLVLVLGWNCLSLCHFITPSNPNSIPVQCLFSRAFFLGHLVFWTTWMLVTIGTLAIFFFFLSGTLTINKWHILQWMHFRFDELSFSWLMYLYLLLQIHWNTTFSLLYRFLSVSLGFSPCSHHRYHLTWMSVRYLLVIMKGACQRLALSLTTFSSVMNCRLGSIRKTFPEDSLK